MFENIITGISIYSIMDMSDCDLKTPHFKAGISRLLNDML